MKTPTTTSWVSASRITCPVSRLTFRMQSATSCSRRRREQAAVTSTCVKAAGQQLVADVTVQNLTGHRFPSGVGFRRAFLQFQVTDKDGKMVWISGGTNSNGEIVGPDGKVLPTEYFEIGPDGKQQYQPHYYQENPITSQNTGSDLRRTVDGCRWQNHHQLYPPG